MYLCEQLSSLSKLSTLCICVDVCTTLNYTSLMCVQGSVLMQMSVNIRSPSQRWMLNGINGKNGCTLFYTWGLHCWWGHFYHPTMLRENVKKVLHFTSLFTLAPHTAAPHKHEWRHHFWNGTGGVWWHLAWELSTLIALAIKSEEKDQEHVSKPLLGTCCLLYLEQSLWLLDGRPLHLFLSFQPEGNFISLQCFFPRTFVIEHSTKVSGQKTLVKQERQEVAREGERPGGHFNKILQTSAHIFGFDFVTPFCITNVSL